MKTDQTGKIAEDLYVLGSAEIPSYLLDGPKPALFDAGLSCLGPLYDYDARKILGDNSPQILFVTHSHFDHLGAVSHLKRAFPGMAVAGSSRTAEILKRPKAVELMTFLSEQSKEYIQAHLAKMDDRDLSELKKRYGDTALGNGSFEPFEVDMILEDGDVIDLGDDRTVEVIATPGHTRDFLSYYIPERKILISSESVGCENHQGHIYTEFLVSYDQYMDSMKRLRALEVETLCVGHYFAFTGPDAESYFTRSIEAAQGFKARVEQLLIEEDGDVDRVVTRIKAEEYDSNPGPKQAEPAYLLNIGIRVNHLKKRMPRFS